MKVTCFTMFMRTTVRKKQLNEFAHSEVVIGLYVSVKEAIYRNTCIERIGDNVGTIMLSESKTNLPFKERPI